MPNNFCDCGDQFEAFTGEPHRFEDRQLCTICFSDACKEHLAAEAAVVAVARGVAMRIDQQQRLQSLVAGDLGNLADALVELDLRDEAAHDSDREAVRLHNGDIDSDVLARIIIDAMEGKRPW